MEITYSRFLKLMAVMLAYVLILSMVSSVSIKVNAQDQKETFDNNVESSIIYYSEYLQSYASTPFAQKEIPISGDLFTPVSTDTTIEEIAGRLCAVSIEDGQIEWQVDIPETGMYCIKLLYYNVEGNRRNIERALYINNALPFTEAGFFTFSRTWEDSVQNYETDSSGNELRPEQHEVFRWSEAYLTDSTGYFQEPMQFYLTKGSHLLRLVSVREPMAVAEITLCPPLSSMTYREYDEIHPKQEGLDTIYLEAEHYTWKSDFNTIAYNDRSSVFTTPQDAFKIRLNAIGGTNWQTVGQSLSWEIPVTNAGRYQIVLRYRQNIKTDTVVARKVLLDGELPFKEAEVVEFPYNGKWRNTALGDGKQPFSFYLTEGTHTITLEAVLGSLSGTLEKVNQIIQSLNTVYRDILMITGSSPDFNRDYEFDIILPETMANIAKQADLLAGVSDILKENGNTAGQGIGIIDELVFQLQTMSNQPETISRLFSTFKGNLSALGSWSLSMSEQPLELDSIRVLPETESFSVKDKGFWKQLCFAIQRFISSFFIDYNEIGQMEGNNSSNVEVWLTSGRDQAQIMKTLSESSFSKQENIGITVKLVSQGTLLSSVLAQVGPDVALSDIASEPIDYAVRGAAQDLSKFYGFSDALKRFTPEALRGYQYNGGTYALPTSVSFPMLFYRTDIFAEMGWTIPQTSAEFYRLIPEIQKRNMQIGFPSDITGFKIFLYQKGLSLYNENLTAVSLGTDDALDAFASFTRLFTIYGLPVTYAFADRFRSGEIPIAIADYITSYNQLTVFAPEIRGLWGIAPVPDMTGTNGSPVSPATAMGIMMMKSAKNKEDAWRFIDWWTADETQFSYCNEMETVVGIAAKQATANTNVLSRLGWTAGEYRQLSEQFVNLQGTPEVPGSYYIPRYFGFAFNNVYSNSVSSDSAIRKYIKTIDEEINRKRAEFLMGRE